MTSRDTARLFVWLTIKKEPQRSLRLSSRRSVGMGTIGQPFSGNCYGLSNGSGHGENGDRHSQRNQSAAQFLSHLPSP